MSRVIVCEICGSRLRVGEEYAGKHIRCPACKQVLKVDGQQVGAKHPEGQGAARVSPSPDGSRESRRRVSPSTAAGQPHDHTEPEMAASARAEDSRPSETRADLQWSKIAAGMLALLLGIVCTAVALTVSLALIDVRIDDDPYNPLTAPKLAVAFAAVLIGFFFSKGSTLGKVVYVVSVGIFGGFLSIKGWDLIEEGRRTQGMSALESLDKLIGGRGPRKTLPRQVTGETSSEKTGASPQLASYADRFGGALIDGLVMLAIQIPVAFVWSLTRELYHGRPMAFRREVFLSFFDNPACLLFFGIGGFLIVNGYLLARYGQTVGKKLVGTRIVANSDGSRLPFLTLYGLRYLPIQLIGLIPLVGPAFCLVDVLFILGRDRRCIHDLIADTKVVYVAA